MSSSAFPSPVIGHGNHHSNGNSGNCCVNGGYTGSQTLPANCNGNVQDWSSRSSSTHAHNCPNSNNDDGDLDWWTVSGKTMGMFALSLVFILIWTSVISGILVTHSYREHEISSNGAELFVLQKQIGHFAFLLGREMINVLNVTSKGNYSNDSTTETQSLINVTDNFMIEIQQSLTSKGLPELYEDLSEILTKFRARCRIRPPVEGSENEQFEAVTHTTECVQAYEHQLRGLESFILKDNPWLSERHSKLIQNDLILKNLPYTLFIKGVLHRFACLGTGMVLVNYDINSTPLTLSEYNHYFYSSRQLIESSFLWNQRFLSKYIDLEKSDDTSSELWMKIFELPYGEERQFNDKLLALFHQLVGFNGLKRIRSEIKKKNAERTERIVEIDEDSGTRSKYVADPNQILFHIKSDSALQKYALEDKIGQIISEHEHKSSMVESRMNLSMNYNQVIINQFDFLARVQDFLNISISAQLVQSQLSEKHNFVYHSMVSAILICFVLFCLLLFIWSYCFSRNLPLTPQKASHAKMPWGRRMRRRFWALGASPLTLLRGCFSSPSTKARSQRPSHLSGAGSNRYPLLYKSSNHHRSQSPSCNNNGQANGPCNQCLNYAPSPKTFLLTSKRTWHRYLAATSNHQSIHQNGQSNSASFTPQHRHVFKARNGVNGHRHIETAMMKLSTNNEQNGGDLCHRSNSHGGCCGACRDPSCTGSYNPVESAKYSAPPQNDQCLCHNCSMGNGAAADDDTSPPQPPSSSRLEQRNAARNSAGSNVSNNTTSRKENNYVSTPSLMHKSLSRHASRESTLSVEMSNSAVDAEAKS